MFNKIHITTQKELDNALIYCRTLDIIKSTLIFTLLAILLSRGFNIPLNTLSPYVFILFLFSCLINYLCQTKRIKNNKHNSRLEHPIHISIWELYKVRAIDIVDNVKG